MRTYELSINGSDYKVKVKSFSTDHAELEVNGKVVQVAVKNVGDDMAGRPVAPRPQAAPARGPSSVPAGASAKTPMASVAGAGTPVIAPIPGAIMEVFVKEGQEVKSGQPVLKMEAMKMENVINAHADGRVLSILVSPGEAVSQGKALLMIG
jgi:biotin carboxyl carrier protein